MPANKSPDSRQPGDEYIRKAVEEAAIKSRLNVGTKKTKRRRLTPLGKKILTELVRDPDQTVREVAGKVGVSHNSVQNVMCRQSTQELMQEMMENDPKLRLLLNRRALLVKLAEGLNAEKKSYFADKGRVRDTKKDVDFQTRGFYLNLATRINGAQSQKVELSGPGGAPLLPPGLEKAVADLDEATLKSLVTKLLTLE